MTVNVNGYVAPALTTDAILLKGDEVLLIRRKDAPFAGAWAIPGGFVEPGETVEAACVRELAEETGLMGAIVDLLGVWSDPKRDPRGHTVTVAYVCRVRGFLPTLLPGSDAADARWFRLAELPAPLAFDHDDLLRAAREWLATSGNRARLADEECD